MFECEEALYLCDEKEYISNLRERLWKEGKIRIEGYTYKEWIAEQGKRLGG